MKRVVIFTTGLGVGGAETQLLRVADALVARGVRVTIVSLIDRNLWGDRLERSGIRYVCLHMKRGRPTPGGVAQAIALLVRERPHLLLSFLTAANVLARVVGPLAGVPAIVTSIRSAVAQTWRGARYEFALAKRDQALVFNAQTVADDAIARGLVRAERAHVIRNALDLDAFDARASAAARVSRRAEAGVSDDAFVWISVGNVHARKNMSALVRAFRRLHSDAPSTRLWIVGRHYDDYPVALEAAGRLVDEGVVRFWGLRDDVPELLAGADAFALSSKREGTPNVVIEAHAARLPVVATDVGGTREMIEEGESGWLIASPDAEATEAALRRVMALPLEERRALGQRGRARVEREHAAPVVLDAWVQLLRDASERGRSRAGRR